MSDTKQQQPYFPHNANSRNQDSLVRLRMEHGVAGYGVYYMLLERLRLADGYKCELDWQVLSWDLDCNPELIKSVIYDFDLFIITDEGTMFQSVELNSYMKIMEEKKKERSQRAKEAANTRWGKSTETTPETLPPEVEETTDDDSNDKPEDTFRLDQELAAMERDTVWLEALSKKTGKSTSELISFLPAFRERCVLKGYISQGHKDMADAYGHFESWLYRTGRVAAEGNKPISADKIRKGKRLSQVETDRIKQLDIEMAERNAEYERRESAKGSPADWIRCRGYDPNEVTIAMLMTPGWTETHPPTHPEWIIKTDILEPVEAE